MAKRRAKSPKKNAHAARTKRRPGKAARSAVKRLRPSKSGGASRRGPHPAAQRAKKSDSSLLIAPGLKALVDASPKLSRTVRELEKSVTFTATPKTVSGKRIQAHRGELNLHNSNDFRPRTDAQEGAVARLLELGFEIVHRGEFGIAARGPAKLVSDVLKIKLALHARPRRTSMRATQSFSMDYEPPESSDLFVAPVESLTVKSTISDHIDDFIFAPPPRFSAEAQPAEPDPKYFSIGKDEIRRLLNVPPGLTGANVTIGMVDSGFFRHPYYVQNNLDLQPIATPSSPDPASDSEGHGTAMAYNIFAVAPGVTIKGFKRTSAPEIALEDAAKAGVDIICCAWGFESESRFSVVEETIKSIVNQGKIVLFASGDIEKCWPASMPQVLAIGGVYADDQNQLEASNCASGFVSGHADYNNRRVPDVCGLCGQKPKGIYITLPCPPGCEIDKSYGGQKFPSRDETLKSDGWLSASGTSSATAQIAGVVALMVERARNLNRPPLTTASVKAILERTAVSVQRGMNAQGFQASGHPNVAVGFGLVDATAAVAAV